jgi:SAM-dependent methyltransferase
MTSTLMEGREGIDARAAGAVGCSLACAAMLRLANGLWRSVLASDRFNRVRERARYGGERRRAALMKALVAHDKSLQYRQWRLSGEMPHFYDHRIGSLLFAAGEGSGLGMYRAYLAAQVMQPGDVVLDIGCGDGFFAHRFFAPRVAHVDSIDVERSAIDHAQRHHAAPNIAHHLLDAVADPFPRSRYDVVVWDGALGHFAPEVTREVLAKIGGVLSEGGLFVGSETLGDEGHDHLQFFSDLEALRTVLGAEFPVVRLTQMRYGARHEAYWRCALGPSERLEFADWR